MLTYLITLFLVILWALKFIAIFNAISWLRANGENYKKCFEDASQSIENKFSETMFFEAFEKCNGDVLPFGIKDYKLRRFVNNRKKFIYTFFQKWLFRFNHIIVITSVYLIFSIFLTKFNYSIYLTQDRYTLLFVALLPLAGNIILAVESVYSYAVLDSYAVLFHMHSPTNGNFGSLKILELRVLLSKVIAALLSGTIACYVSFVLFEAFKNIPNYETLNPLNWLQILWHFFYFTVTTFLTVGYGDILPANEYGQLIAFLIMTQGVMLVVVVFSSLSTSNQIFNELKKTKNQT